MNFEVSHRSAAKPTGTVLRAPSAFVRRQPPRVDWLLRSGLAGAAALAAGTLLARAMTDALRRPARGGAPRNRPHRQAAVRLSEGAALLSASVLADSTLEHYRGGFHNKAMFIAPTVAAVTLATSLHGRASHDSQRERSRNGVRASIYGAAFATGLIGTGFHFYNVGKRPGGFSWENLFYAAPLGAPAAIILAGAFGWMSERAGESGSRAQVLGVPLGRAAGALTVIGLLGNVAEVSLLHFRGAFQNPFMYLPITIPPVAALALARATLFSARKGAPFARYSLATTAAMGFAGVGFHSYGIARNMGGWKNWSQMILQGPPLPAPPSFTGLAFAGLGAVRLMEAAQ